MNENGYFPMFFDIKGKKIVVIGGGRIAERRILTLLLFKPNITVIAPRISENIRMEYEKGNLEWKERIYKEGDTKNTYMVLAVTNDRKINEKIYLDCKDKVNFLNIADCKEESNFYFPAVIKEDDIVIGVTASGNNHSKVKNTANNIRNMNKILPDKN